MSIGHSKLNILQQSPHDFLPPQPQNGSASKPEITGWIPSRYNIRATTEGGRLVLWNTYSGAMNVFKAEQAARVKSALKKQGADPANRGLVEYLADRGYLIKEGTNEYRRLQVAISQQQYRNNRLELILLSSEDCNFRCKYCYEEFARGTMRPDVRSSVKKLVQSRISEINFLQIGWFGGEPLYGLKAKRTPSTSSAT